MSLLLSHWPFIPLILGRGLQGSLEAPQWQGTRSGCDSPWGAEVSGHCWAVLADMPSLVLHGGRGQCLLTHRPWWFLFLKGGGCAWIIRVSHCSASKAKLMPGNWKGGSNHSSNLRLKRSNADSVMAMEQWTFKSLPLKGNLRGHGNLFFQFTSALWTWKKPIWQVP